jgi:hypothetical protein
VACDAAAREHRKFRPTQGKGTDTFNFEPASIGNNTINNFNPSQDTIVFKRDNGEAKPPTEDQGLCGRRQSWGLTHRGDFFPRMTHHPRIL